MARNKANISPVPGGAGADQEPGSLPASNAGGEGAGAALGDVGDAAGDLLAGAGNAGADLGGDAALITEDAAATSLNAIWDGWVASVSFPTEAVLRNNGDLAVVEPVTAAFVSAGGNVHITLLDEAHASRVIENLAEINASKIGGGIAVCIDGVPGELLTKKGG
jgi:hypothetical protein